MTSASPVRMWPRPGMVFSEQHALDERLRKCIPFLLTTEYETILNEFLEFGAYITSRHDARYTSTMGKHAVMMQTYAMTAWLLEAEMLMTGVAGVLDEESPAQHFFGDDGRGNFGWWSLSKIASQNLDLRGHESQ